MTDEKLVKNRVEAGENFTGLLVDNHQNGNIRIRAEFKHGLLEGDYMTGRENGHYESKGTYQKNYRVGPFYLFDENGKMTQRILYPNSAENIIIGKPFLQKGYYDKNGGETNTINYT